MQDGTKTTLDLKNHNARQNTPAASKGQQCEGLCTETVGPAFSPKPSAVRMRVFL